MTRPIQLIGTIGQPTALDTPGGIEVFNAQLAQGLVKKNRPVSLYASGDSAKELPIKPIVDRALLTNQADDLDVRQLRSTLRRLITQESVIYTKLIQELPAGSIIHSSTPNFLVPYLAVKAGFSVVVTLHLPADSYHYQALFTLLSQQELTKISFIAISKFQAQNFPAQTTIIPNAIDANNFVFNPVGNNPYIWIGRLVPEKGIEEVVEIARQKNLSLRIGAIPTDAIEKAYFTENIEPLINSNKIEHRGHIGLREKSEFYNGKAFLFPLNWDEPFGLTVIEAMACGTPVITYDRGAMAEIVDNGVTGFVCPPGDREAFNQAIAEIEAMPAHEYQAMRQACRKRVEEHYQLNRLVDDYCQIYDTITE